MDETDKKLLVAIRQRIPLCRRPYREIAKKIGIDEADILLRLHRLKENGWFHRFRPVFDTKMLGYRGILVAMRVPDFKLDEAAAHISVHPGVRVGMKRNHAFNVWFSLVLPADEIFEEHVEKLHEQTGAEATLLLPVLKSYKRNPHDRAEQREKEKRYFSAENDDLSLKLRQNALSEPELKCIRNFQDEFPLTDNPFEKVCLESKLSENEVLLILKQMQRKGYFLGVCADFEKEGSEQQKSLLVWKIPEERRDQLGKDLAGVGEILSCSLRPSTSGFPYSLFTELGTGEAEAAQKIIGNAEARIGAWPHCLLICIKIFKETRLKLFPSELEQWRIHAGVKKKDDFRKTKERKGKSGSVKGQYALLNSSLN